MNHTAAVAARDVKPSTLAAIAAAAREGESLYIQLERIDHARLRHELAERLAARGLELVDEGPGWLRVARARHLVQDDACQVARCGGRIRFGRRCSRCGTLS